MVQLSDKDALTWVDLQAQLMAFENRLEQLNNFSNLTLNPSANVVAKSDSRGIKSYARGTNKDSNQRGGRGRGRGRMSRDKQICQVCGKAGHVAVYCYFSFDKAYMGHPPDENKSEKRGNQNFNAFIASPESVQDSDWYFDSGASNHVTHDSNRFQEIAEHDGKSKLTIGNGDNLKILATGSTTLCTHKKPLKLHEVLYVPKITKNLLSVSRLASDNNIFVEFHATKCFVKDKATGMVLLEGKIEDGLYQLSSMSSNNNKGPSVFLSIMESWHKRPGHPNSKVLDEVMRRCKVKAATSDQFNFCEACQYGKSHLLPIKISSSRAQEPLDLIHIDVWGPAPINSTSGFRYYVFC